jgi:hypothetical protein
VGEADAGQDLLPLQQRGGALIVNFAQGCHLYIARRCLSDKTGYGKFRLGQVLKQDSHNENSRDNYSHPHVL